MQSIPAIDPAIPSTMFAEDIVDRPAPGRILLAVFEALERAGISYCVLHGYEGYPQRIKSDVDCMISAEVSADELLALLHHNRIRIGASVVHFRHYRGFFIVLAGKNADGSVCFVQLDFRLDYELGDLRFYAGS